MKRRKANLSKSARRTFRRGWRAFTNFKVQHPHWEDDSESASNFRCGFIAADRYKHGETISERRQRNRDKNWF